MPLRPIDSVRALYAAMALVVAGFLGANLMVQRAAAHIEEHAAEIVNDTAPSVQYLGVARAEMHQLEVLVHDYVNGVIPPGNMSALEEAQDRLSKAVAAYIALPAASVELELLGTIRREMATLTFTTHEAVRLTHGGDTEGAMAIIRGPLHQAAERAREAITANIELHAHSARRAAGTIEGIRGHAARVATVANILMVLLAAVTAVLTGRIIRRYGEVMRRYADLQEQRATELEQFAGRVAHDVLSPLTPVAAALDVVEDRLDMVVDDDDEGLAMHHVRRARAGLGRVQRLVGDLLDFAKSGAKPATPTPSQVAAVVHEVADELAAEAHAARVQLRLEVPEGLSVECSGALLAVAVRNLVRNAIKYMGAATTRRVTVRAAASGHRVRLEVEDTGPGLAPGLETQVFEPYVRGPTGGTPGTGLGLATVKRIAESHGGQAGVRPAAEGGCVFWVLLPMASLGVPRIAAERVRTDDGRRMAQ